MKLDRSATNDGRGKYGLIKARRLARLTATHSPGVVSEIEHAIAVLEAAELIEWGLPGSAEEFFVMKLKDKWAGSSLATYAQQAISEGETEFGAEVLGLAARSAGHPLSKKPD